MIRFFVVLHFWAVAGCVAVFAAVSNPSPWIGFLMGAPHWPMWGMQHILGRQAFETFYRSSDWILLKIGYHPWIHCALILFLGGIFLFITLETKGKLRFLAFCLSGLLLIPLISAHLSGIYLQRGYKAFTSENFGANRSRAFTNLMFGAMTPDLNAPRDAVIRLSRMTGDSNLVRRPTNDTALHNLANRAERFFPELRSLMGNKRGGEQLKTMLFGVELSLRMTMAPLLFSVEHGIGGDPEQPWREIRVEGPLGPIRFRSNLLPGMPGFIHLMPAYLEDGKKTALRRFHKAVKELKPEETGAWESLAVEMEKAEYPNDVLLQMWYSTLYSFSVAKLGMTALVHRNRGFKFSPVDKNGELIINLHNSCQSYYREVSTTPDIAGAGIYFADRNEIHVWTAEKEDIRNLNRGMLEQLAKIGQDTGYEEDAFRTALSTPPTRFSTVLGHELSHWTVNALLSHLGAGPSGIPPAVTEGLALMIDEMGSLAFDSLGAELGARPENSFVKPMDETCPATQARLSWMCKWFGGKKHMSRNPADLIRFDQAMFYRGGLGNYADAWALVTFFGEDLLSDLGPVRENLWSTPERKQILALPWASLKTLVNASKSNLPYLMQAKIDKCGTERVLRQHASIDGNGAP